MYAIPTTEATPKGYDFASGKPENNPFYAYMDDKLENVLLHAYGAKRGAVLGVGAMGGVCKLEVAYPNNEVHVAKFKKLCEYLRTDQPVIKYADDPDEAAFSELLYRRYKDAQSKKPFARPPPVCMPTIGRVFKVTTPGKPVYAIIREDIKDNKNLEPDFRALWAQHLTSMSPYEFDGLDVISNAEADLYTASVGGGWNGDKLSDELAELKSFFSLSAAQAFNKTNMVHNTAARLDALRVWIAKYEIALRFITGFPMNRDVDGDIEIFIDQFAASALEFEKKHAIRHRTHKKVLAVAFKMLLRLLADVTDLWLWMSSERVRIVDMHNRNYGVALTPLKSTKLPRLRLVYRDLGMAEDNIYYQNRLEPWPSDDASHLAGLRSGARRGRVRRR